MLDLRRLRLLRELEARGTLVAVAEALGYSPSAVSQGLAALEREAGVSLVEPAGRGVVLTDAGRVLARHAGVLLAQLERAEADLAAAAETVRGRVRIGGLESAVLHGVVPAMERLAVDAPAVRVELVEAELEQTLPALRLGALDIALGDEYEGLPRPRAADLQRETLLREELLLVLPADHPLAGRSTVPTERLAHESWAVAEQGTGHHDVLVRTCRERGGFEPDLRHRTPSVAVLLALVQRTGALTMLPELVLGDAGPGVVTRRLEGGGSMRELFALTRTGAAHRPGVAAVLAALRGVLGADGGVEDRRDAVDAPQSAP
jgi:DNA-binding transcriptional LysR family regulator